MHFKYRNVNHAFRELVKSFLYKQTDEPSPKHVPIERSSSRNGDVLYIQEPVIITYTHPRERVLFNQARDCNPFFHLYESLWMLAGRNDVAPLAYYNSNMANYSDDGQTFNGAYGHRWRHVRGEHLGDSTGWADEYDQLRILIDHLKAVPDSRRAVLQMWNVEDDLLKIGPQNQSKDVCCNTHVYFAIRTVAPTFETSSSPDWVPSYGCRQYLDMTVCNRSNDLIWGLLGANVVHFSFLQEYMAACLRVEVGVYNQVSNNLHVYLNDKWQPEKWLADDTDTIYDTDYRDFQEHEGGWRMPMLVKYPTTFDKELPEFVERHSKCADCWDWKEPFFKEVAEPMMLAFHWHKSSRRYDLALEQAEKIQAYDWRIAATNWLLKRKANYEAKTSSDKS